VPALPTRSPMARARREIDTFTIPEGRRRRVYRPGYNVRGRARVVNSKCAGTRVRSPGERSDTRDHVERIPAYRCAHAGYDVTLCELICSSCKHNLRRQPATNQPDGQITKNLSSPSRKNIPLNVSGKSVLSTCLSRPGKRGVSRSSRTRDGMRWTRERRREKWLQGRVYPVSGSRRAGRTALQRTAKPFGPDTRGWCQAAGGEFDPTGSIEPSSRQ
jgi:hypothetical protein